MYLKRRKYVSLVRIHAAASGFIARRHFKHHRSLLQRPILVKRARYDIVLFDRSESLPISYVVKRLGYLGQQMGYHPQLQFTSILLIIMQQGKDSSSTEPQFQPPFQQSISYAVDVPHRFHASIWYSSMLHGCNVSIYQCSHRLGVQKTTGHATERREVKRQKGLWGLQTSL